ICWPEAAKARTEGCSLIGSTRNDEWVRIDETTVCVNAVSRQARRVIVRRRTGVINSTVGVERLRGREAIIRNKPRLIQEETIRSADRCLPYFSRVPVEPDARSKVLPACRNELA